MKQIFRLIAGSLCLATALFLTGCQTDPDHTNSGQMASLEISGHSEVEILRVTEENQEAKVFALLGKGDFFGESALLDKRPLDSDIRARSSVRVMQMGSDLFAQLAGASQSFRDTLSQAMARRTEDFWRRLPLVKTLLENEALQTFLEPLPARSLTGETTLAEAVAALNESAGGELLILDAKQRLWGTLDRGNLYEIVSRIALIPVEKQGDVPGRKLSEFLSEDTLSITAQDSVQAAVATMLDHNVSWMPVVQSKEDPRPVGVLRAARISGRLLEKIGLAKTDRAGAAG